MELYHLLIISLSDRRPRHHGAVPPPQESMPYFSTSFGLFFISSLTLALCLCWPFPTVTVSVFSPSRPLPSIAASTPPPPLPSASPTHLFSLLDPLVIPFVRRNRNQSLSFAPSVSSFVLEVVCEGGIGNNEGQGFFICITWLICWSILGVVVYYILISLTVCWNV